MDSLPALFFSTPVALLEIHSRTFEELKKSTKKWVKLWCLTVEPSLRIWINWFNAWISCQNYVIKSSIFWTPFSIKNCVHFFGPKPTSSLKTTLLIVGCEKNHEFWFLNAIGKEQLFQKKADYYQGWFLYFFMTMISFCNRWTSIISVKCFFLWQTMKYTFRFSHANWSYRFICSLLFLALLGSN